MTVLLVAAILALAGFVHGMLGFGTALVAMPLLSLFIAPATATPLVCFAMLTVIVVILGRGWRGVNVAAAWRLLIGSVVGLPIGLGVLVYAPEAWVKSVLGVAVAGLGIYNLRAPMLPRLGSAWAFGAGFVSGVLGGAYNLNAAPAVAFAATQGWSSARFHATLQGYFLPASILVWVGQGLSGLWTAEGFHYYLIALPGLLLGVYVGQRAAQRLPTSLFERTLNCGLVGMGILLVASSVR